MGTNYYLEPKAPCDGCGRSFERLHIGKSSAGWCFSLHIDPDEGINSLADWESKWSAPGARIINEYGEVISIEDMKQTIINRKWGGISTADPSWLEQNGAEPGPAGLARHSVGGSCIGHGTETYDLIRGEFS